MSAPERIAMCTADGGENLHIPLKPGEPCPTTCFQDCDCTPVEFVRVPVPGDDEDPDDPFGIALIGETVGHCSICDERREAFYTCRDGGETVPLVSPSHLPEEGDHA